MISTQNPLNRCNESLKGQTDVYTEAKPLYVCALMKVCVMKRSPGISRLHQPLWSARPRSPSTQRPENLWDSISRVNLTESRCLRDRTSDSIRTGRSTLAAPSRWSSPSSYRHLTGGAEAPSSDISAKYHFRKRIRWCEEFKGSRSPQGENVGDMVVKGLGLGLDMLNLPPADRKSCCNIILQGRSSNVQLWGLHNPTWLSVSMGVKRKWLNLYFRVNCSFKWLPRQEKWRFKRSLKGALPTILHISVFFFASGVFHILLKKIYLYICITLMMS